MLIFAIWNVRWKWETLNNDITAFNRNYRTQMWNALGQHILFVDRKWRYKNTWPDVPPCLYDRHIQNHVKYLKMECFAKKNCGYKPLTIFAKHFIINVWQHSNTPLPTEQNFTSLPFLRIIFNAWKANVPLTQKPKWVDR